MAKKQLFNYTFTPATRTIVLSEKIRQRELLLITNTTDGEIIYSFADSTKGITSLTYNSTTDYTTIVLAHDTTSMSASDELQIFKEVKDLEVIPGENYADPVNKFRVSNPQSMIDTDFEYSLQPFKWETLELINNLPSVYVKANEPFLTSGQIEKITVENITLGGGNTFNTGTGTPYNSTTGLSSIGISGDESHTLVSLPSPTEIDGVSYSTIWVSSNSFVSFTNGTVPNYGFYRATNTLPSAPTWFIGSGDYTQGGNDTRVNNAYAGTITNHPAYTAGTQVYVLRWEGNDTWFGQGTRTWEFHYALNNPGVVTVNLISIGNGGNQFYALSNGGGSWVIPPTSSFFTSGTIGVAPKAVSALVTVETASAHGKLVGDPVVIKESLDEVKIDGAYVVSSVPSTTEFSYNIGDTTGLKIGATQIDIAHTAGETNFEVFLPSHGYKVGDSVYIDMSVATATTGTPETSGIYEVLATPAPSLDRFYLASSHTAAGTATSADIFQNFRGAYTAVYSGGFFEGTVLDITSIDSIAGTNHAKITFTESHGLFVTAPLYVIDPAQSLADHIGGFEVYEILSDTEITYITRAGTYSSSAALTTAAEVYVRPEGTATHRVYDGGVQITPATNTPNAQIIRQTRKYFRYQSGKGYQFSTGILFMPTYDVTKVSGNVFNGDTYLQIFTEQEHGFVQPVPNQVISPSINLKGFEVVQGSNIYNGIQEVFSVESKKAFTIKFTGQVATDLSPGGVAFVEVKSWNDASVRTGMFDEQNGLFFEHDGATLWAVKRSATFQIRGTATLVRNSNKVYGFNTKFTSNLKEGDYINARGISLLVHKIIDDTTIEVSPKWRGEENAANIKLTRVEEIRIPQSQFNLDTLDGNGPSGYNFDPNKMQMVYIDYSWYGAGKVRWGVRTTTGDITYIHYLKNNNINTEAYMRSGNLPGRFEISNKSKSTTITGPALDISATASYAGNNASTVTFTTTSAHGLFAGDQFELSASADVNRTPLTLYQVKTVPSSTTLTVDAKVLDRNSYSLATTITLAIRSGTTSGHVLQVEDTEYFPTNGVARINNEYFQYTKTSATELTLNTRNLKNLTNQTNAVRNDTILSTNQNFAPALSHWGTSVIMDGRFDEDKSYLFTAITNSVVTVAPGARVPLVSIRLAPSVDYGIGREFGTRNLINRSLLTLKNVGTYSLSSFSIALVLNSESNGFKNINNWEEAGNGSLAQYVDHSITSVGALDSGDTIFEYFTEDGGRNQFAVSNQEITVVRELSNSIIGGNNIFPDGPDILTIYATNLDSQSSTIRGRLSWSESQG